jgi:hypothetical protein
MGIGNLTLGLVERRSLKVWRKIIQYIFCGIFTLIAWIPFLGAQTSVNYSDFSQWQTIKGKHFVVYFYNKEHAATASQVLSKAEAYYDKIAYQIGYSRYSDFWTWEDRVKVFIFPDQLSFFSTTGQHLWSKGYAIRDSKLFESRAIVTFMQEDGFIDKLLPHEISHLIVKDFIGFDRPLPVWFDEGLAQQLETSDSAQEQAMILLAKNNQSIPFEIFRNLDIRRETDELKVAIFYAQSRSVVEFLIKVYGQEAFGRLCINLRDAMDFSDAVTSAYPATIDSISNLEQKWLSYMREK